MYPSCCGHDLCDVNPSGNQHRTEKWEKGQETLLQLIGKNKQMQIYVLCRRIHTFYIVIGIEMEG